MQGRIGSVGSGGQLEAYPRGPGQQRRPIPADGVREGGSLGLSERWAVKFVERERHVVPEILCPLGSACWRIEPHEEEKDLAWL